ncbi:MAG: Penicillin-binding protein 2D [Firmicutes bacterium ADurb.Bin456]|nr:MAG: Penicillin-binding protein 2D [Firmicutes bacterium ADurb.Bin456]
MSTKKPLTRIILLFILIGLGLVFAGAGCKAHARVNPGIPAPSRVLDGQGETVTVISDENRIPVSLDQVSPYMQDAIVAIEDARFYRHKGVDPVSLARALFRNLRAGKVVEGGSTITQQLAKNLYLHPGRSIGRKLEELFLTIQLERTYTKKEILEMYLNEIYFGQGAYGIEMASRTYFSKPALALNLAESAILAGIPRGPSIYNPAQNMKAAKARQETVLNRMVELGMISGEQAGRAEREPLLPSTKPATVRNAPHFTDEVVKYYSQNYSNGLETLYSSGLLIYTTLDLKMQEAAEKAMAGGLENLDPGLEGALVALDPKTGRIKAMVGGRDYAKSQLNRVFARSQPGSAFKPFLYAAAIDRGYTAGTTIVCEPVRFPQAGGEDYVPRDYQGYYHFRPFTLKEALFTSDNVVAIRLNDQLGPGVMAGYAKRMGIDSSLRPYLSLPLGTSEVTPLELARAFGTLANRGVKTEPYFIQKIVDGAGRVLEERKPLLEQVLDEKTAYIVTDMLTGVLRPGGTAAGPGGTLGRPAAGKTGTTENLREAWFVGYTPDLVAAVYIGYDDKSREVGLTGADVAAPIWADFIKGALEGVPPSEFPVPDGVTKVNICADDGLLAGEFNTRVIEAAFVQGTEPTSACHGYGPGYYLPYLWTPGVRAEEMNLFKSENFATGVFGRGKHQ